MHSYFQAAFRRIKAAPRLIALSIAFIVTLFADISAKAETAYWAGPTGISAAGQLAANSQVRLSSDGTKATAVWSRNNGTNWIIQSRSATISGQTATWGSPIDLSTVGQDASFPQVALSSDGTKATVVWHYRPDGTTRVIQSKSATISGNQANWGSVTNLSDAALNAVEPHVAISADGTKATAVWSYNGGGIQSVSATISGNTATWGAVNDLTDSARIAFSPRIALSSDGAMATAVWYRSDGNWIVQSKSAIISGSVATWSSAIDLSAAGQDSYDPQVALSADGGKASVVWHSFNGSSYIIHSSSATISGNTAIWGAVADLCDTAQNFWYPYPHLALSSDGTKAMAVWWGANGSDYLVQASVATISGNSATWSAISDLSGSATDFFNPRVAMSSDGTKATVIWDRPNVTCIVESRSAVINENTPTWSPVTSLTDAGQAYMWAFPQIALSADGTLGTAVWDAGVIQSSSVEVPNPTPTATPTSTPSNTPSSTPTNTPSSTPTLTATPSATSTFTPAATVTVTPAYTETSTPMPTATPTGGPVLTQTNTPAPTNTIQATPTRGKLPDLVVRAVTGPGSWRRGATGIATVTIRNQGSRKAATSFVTSLYLSNDPGLNVNGATRIAKFRLSSLAGATTVTKTLALRLPQGISRKKYYLLAYTDSQDDIVEANDTNNIRQASIRVSVIR